eukprot:4442032-Lingulodinium_polyedra.AAC.1
MGAPAWPKMPASAARPANRLGSWGRGRPPPLRAGARARLRAPGARPRPGGRRLGAAGPRGRPRGTIPRLAAHCRARALPGEACPTLPGGWPPKFGALPPGRRAAP